MLLFAVPTRAAPATSPRNWKSPIAYWPFIPKRGPAPVNNELVVSAVEAVPSGLWKRPRQVLADTRNLDAAEDAQLERTFGAEGMSSVEFDGNRTRIARRH